MELVSASIHEHMPFKSELLVVAAAEVVFRRLGPSRKINTIEFETLSGSLTAQRVGDRIQMELPAGSTLPASATESSAVEAVLARAIGKPSVGIRYVGFGGPGFINYLLVEVEKTEKLGEWRPRVEHFVCPWFNQSQPI